MRGRERYGTSIIRSTYNKYCVYHKTTTTRIYHRQQIYILNVQQRPGIYAVHQAVSRCDTIPAKQTIVLYMIAQSTIYTATAKLLLYFSRKLRVTENMSNDLTRRAVCVYREQ